MKKYFIVFIPLFLMLVSCARQIKDMNVDMAKRGIYGAKVIIAEDWTQHVFYADTLFFKHLDSTGDFRKGEIIMSRVFDSEGDIVIDADPGVYVLVAARFFDLGVWYISVFDERFMKYSLVELKAGETRIIPETYVLALSGFYYGKDPTDVQKVNRALLGKAVGYTGHSYTLGILDPYKYPDMEEQKIHAENMKEESRLVVEFK